ncbi:MAG: transposase [Pseudomonadota bacterium]
MARKRHSDEDILKLLREIELRLTAGGDVASACRSVEISDATYDNWRKRFGGMGRAQLSEMKSLEKESEPCHANGPSDIGERLRARQARADGRSYKMLTVLDEFTRQALAVTARTKMGADDVLEALYPLLLRHGPPEYTRSDNGPEFVAEALQD